MQGFLMGEGLEGPHWAKILPIDHLTIPIFEHELVPPSRGLFKKKKKKKKKIIHQF